MRSRTHDTRRIAEAFSGHRFRETYDHLAPDVVWLAVGASATHGKDDVVAACEATLTELTHVTTEFTRFVTVADDQTAVVDSIGRYADPDGTISTVASCDIYEFRDEFVTRITSYAVETGTSTSAPEAT